MSDISDYFRTALLIDDRVAGDYRDPAVEHDWSSEQSVRDPAPSLVTPTEEEVGEDATPVPPSELVRAFLAVDVVCGVLEIRDNADTPDDLTKQVRRGAEIADLLILDWLMPRDHPSTIDAIGTVATEYSDRLKVIAVFTGVPNLSGIQQRLIDAKRFEPVTEGIVRRNHTFVLIFGKPSRSVIRAEQDRRVKNYSELPRMIQRDLNDLNGIFGGLMPKFAFGGIKALRDAAPRILATFDRSLDAGALIHRALLPEPADAATQFVRLLASDFEQVLHDQRVGDLWHIDSSRDSLASLTFTAEVGELAQRLRSLHPSEELKAGLEEEKQAETLEELEQLSALGDEELVCEAIARGLNDFRKLGLTERSMRQAVPELTDALDDADVSSQKLAVMMDSTGLGTSAPRLELGVVVRDAQHRYWLCVQPLCDSVRLTDQRDFPMLGINIVQRKATAMIRSPEGEALAVEFDRSPHKLRLVSFVPTEGAVRAEEAATGWSFTDADGNAYLAVTRLRHEFAAQALHALTTTASRVGTDGSEWLRRLGER